MNPQESKLYKDILKQFESLVKEYSITEFDYSTETRIQFGEQRKFYVDLILQLNHIEFYFELTTSINTKVVSNFISLADFKARPNRFFIVYTQSEIFQLLNDQSDFLEFDNLLSLYSYVLEIIKKPIPPNIYLKEIFRAAVTSFNAEMESIKIEHILNSLNSDSFENDLKFDSKNNYFFFTNDVRDSTNFENKFFDCLVEKLSIGDKFYRYGDLKLALFSIKDGTCKFSGIPGMNDISEVGYVENYLDKSYVALRTPQDVVDINSKFILCSSLLKDNLTQWRLYGDDCKGTSIEYEIVDYSNDFITKKISYGIEKFGENYHFELEIVKFIQEEFYSMTGYELKLKTLNVWKHFFKSFEYSVEEEVRVLFVTEPNNPKTNWNLTFTHNILNPFISFNLVEIPMRINRIFFGAKCPENEINLKQFRHLSNLNGQHFGFEQSRIKNYR